jgi:D-xylose 1-dehydrogenase
MSYAAYPSLEGRGVFVTGGASGIGAAFVSAFQAQGANVAFVDLAVEGAPTKVWSRVCDVRRIDDLRQAITDAQADMGPLTVLINNVANDQRQAADDVDAEAWRASMAVNLDHVFHASRFVHPLLQAAGGGSIINLSSINAILGPAGMAPYVAAKAALIGLTKSLAREWGSDRIRVNAISPGWVVTERQLELWLTPEAEDEWREQVALKDRLKPEDVARLALFLAADDSAMITGQNLVIDAGRT